MTKQATTTAMKRMMVLMAVMMAALVALSALSAPDAEAKKKKKGPSFNVVQCRSNISCSGTPGNDYLVGNAGASDAMKGLEGTDVYDGKGGKPDPNANADSYEDSSATSSDFYLVPSFDFHDILIRDKGGSSDYIDLRSYRYADFEYLKFDTDGDGPKTIW